MSEVPNMPEITEKRAKPPKAIKRVIIVGGGNAGTLIANELHADGHLVTIIESDPKRVAEALADNPPDGVNWILADGCEVSDFVKADPMSANVVVAVTGQDQVNLVVSLLAKQEFGVERVVSRVNNPENEWLFTEAWGTDVAVSTPHLLAGLAVEAMQIGTLVRLMSFNDDKVRLSEVTLTESSPAVGLEIQELQLPRSSTVVAIVRDDEVVVPKGDTRLHVRDEVIVLVASEGEDVVRTILVG